MGYINTLSNKIEPAILKTLAYSDIFDFPLTKEEIWSCLLSSKKISWESFSKALSHLEQKLIQKDGFYSLPGREKIIINRKKNLKEVEKKLLIAKKAVNYLSIIPTILFIGVSGGLAIGDADPTDDIDIFIIVRKDTIYATRLWALLFLELLGLRRKRFDNNAPDKICMNFLIDETELVWDTKKQDLYTAHEIIQLKPLFDRGNTYKRFVNSNLWIKKYFPNFNIQKNESINIVYNKSYIKNVISLLIGVLSNEDLFKAFQIAYMKKSKGQNNITTSILAFHPNDYRVQTLKKMNLKLRELGLLTKA